MLYTTVSGFIPSQVPTHRRQNRLGSLYTRYPEWVTDVDGLMSTKCAVCWEALRDVVCNPGTLWLVCWCQLSERRWRPGPHCRRSLSYAGVSCSCLVWCWSAPWPALRELVTAWGSGMKARSAQELIDSLRMCGNKCLSNINRFQEVLMRKWCKCLYWEHLTQMNSCKWVWGKTSRHYATVFSIGGH